MQLDQELVGERAGVGVSVARVSDGCGEGGMVRGGAVGVVRVAVAGSAGVAVQVVSVTAGVGV